MHGVSILWWPVIAGFGALAFLFAILVFVFWVWILIDCIKRKFRYDNEKTIWVIVIILLGWLGALLYFAIIKKMHKNGISK